MKCPFCGNIEDRVVDSRPTDEGDTIRRRRECAGCLKRFTTYEKVEILPLVVIKKDNSREIFNREKLMRGISRACEKRPVSADAMHKVVDEIETQLSNSLEREVTSQSIGELLMDKLKKLDQVAYVRFASVYRDFGDIDTFLDEIHKIRIEENSDYPFSGRDDSREGAGSARQRVGKTPSSAPRPPRRKKPRR
jgi:transcriptional repressor NrdR